jgi:hypothetical protein
MPLAEKLALIELAARNFAAICLLAESGLAGAVRAQRAIAQARLLGLDTKPYAVHSDGYYGWTGKCATPHGIVPAVALMFR